MPPAASDPVSVRPYRDPDAPECARVLAGLPGWFGIPDANAAYLAGLEALPAFVAEREGEVVGFISLRPHGARSAEIEVMAVDAAEHRTGVGTALVDAAEAWLVRNGFVLLHVKTLAPSDPDPGYAGTRAFYEARGFDALFESDAIWGPDNPALVMVKPLL